MTTKRAPLLLAVMYVLFAIRMSVSVGRRLAMMVAGATAFRAGVTSTMVIIAVTARRMVIGLWS
ncbi:conserved hypothetical protein [Stutzerimonas stutzeri A1501]|uniref:Uncharacterized protein n=1 Tax=Stutzerimonas stutzeri (strain A1501) TaxID=379731 RepID=A4VPV2_STUS1|nr:conserved hypothetical protein [Stutzerimonas stutzeri A1501]